jgi:hypothetical protein
MERGPGHVMAHHLKVYELQKRRSLDVYCSMRASAPLRETILSCGRLTKVLTAHLGAALFQTSLHVLALASFVLPYAPDEVVQGLLEPSTFVRICPRRNISKLRTWWAAVTSRGRQADTSGVFVACTGGCSSFCPPSGIILHFDELVHGEKTLVAELGATFKARSS